MEWISPHYARRSVWHNYNYFFITEIPYIELFRSKIAAPITRAIGDISRQSLPPSRFIIVPSTKDIIHDVVLPQAPFDAENTELRSKVPTHLCFTPFPHACLQSAFIAVATTCT